MINTRELEWGLRPFREINALAVYGARTLFQGDRIEFLHDRQSNLGSAPSSEALHSWLNGKAVPALKEHIVKQGWTWNTEETFTFETWSFLFEASPRNSGGYIYLSAYLKGLEKFRKENGPVLLFQESARRSWRPSTASGKAKSSVTIFRTDGSGLSFCRITRQKGS